MSLVPYYVVYTPLPGFVTPPHRSWERVFTGAVSIRSDVAVLHSDEITIICERAFMTLNDPDTKPAGIRSMSVGDVVVIPNGDRLEVRQCLADGWLTLNFHNEEAVR